MTADKPSDMRWIPRRCLIIMLVAAAGQVVTVVGRERILLSYASARGNLHRIRSPAHAFGQRIREVRAPFPHAL